MTGALAHHLPVPPAVPPGWLGTPHEPKTASPTTGGKQLSLSAAYLPGIDAERFLFLGSILLDGTRTPEVAVALNGDDFALEKHRRIYTRMGEMHARGDKIDRYRRQRFADARRTGVV